MVVVPAGSFTMGSPASEVGRYDEEGPQRRITIASPFALGRYELTVEEFGRFVEATHYVSDAERNAGGNQGCQALDDKDSKWDWRSGRYWREPGFAQQGRQPVVCVSWIDAQAYVQWLSRKTGQRYRLPSEAEWEYAARAGSTTSRPWGDDANQACGYANVADQSKSPSGRAWDVKHECNDGHWFTAPVGSYAANRFNLKDMIGNAREWVQDCWEAKAYESGIAPSDGRAYEVAGCSARALRGGSWNYYPRYARSADRNRNTADNRNNNVGFRLARMLP
jgi:formylglycine-generating enzyme required for sulfatase activity